MMVRTGSSIRRLILGFALATLASLVSVPTADAQSSNDDSSVTPGYPDARMPLYGRGQIGDEIDNLFRQRRPSDGRAEFPSPTFGPRGIGKPFGRPNAEAGETLSAKKQLSPAERAAQVRKALAPKPTLAFVRRHTLDELFGKLETAKDPDEAKGVASIITKIWMRSGSDTADLVMQRSLEALDRKQFKVALDLLDHLVELRPEWAEAWNKRASVRFFTGDYDGAMADVEHVLKLEPKHFGALAGMASILQHTGFEKRALEVYRRALMIYPHQPEIERTVDKLTLEVEGQGI